MIKWEAKWTAKFTKWAKYKWKYGSAGIEVKVVLKGQNRFYFNQFKPHQPASLNLAKNKTLIHKEADVGLQQKPFDIWILQGSKAYLVICWLDEPKIGYCIDIDTVYVFINAGVKSLTKEEARDCSEIIAELI